jgi:hypothetical protein
MLQHSPTCCNTVQHVAAQYTTLQHGATCCNPVQHVATQCTISQDRLALGRLNRTAAIDALCENVLSIMRFYRLCLCEGASRQAWEAWAQGRARVLCAWRAHAWAVWGRRLHVVDREEADCVEDDSRRIVGVGVAKGRRPEESGVGRQERPFADLKPNPCTNRERSRRRWHQATVA